MNQELRYALIMATLYGMGAIILQSLLVPFIEISVSRPDLVLVMVLLLARRFGSAPGSTIGFVLGIIQDAVTAMPIGMSALPKAIAGYGAGKMSLFKFEGPFAYLWYILFIFVHEFIYYWLMHFKLDAGFSFLVYSRVFPNTIYTSVMLWIVHFFTARSLAGDA